MNVPGIPEEYDLVRIGYPTTGELYLHDTDVVLEWTDPEYVTTLRPVAIVRLAASWRKMTPSKWDDKPRLARLRQTQYDCWDYDTVVGYRPGAGWKTAKGRFYRQCEVQTNEQDS